MWLNTCIAVRTSTPATIIVQWWIYPEKLRGMDTLALQGNIWLRLRDGYGPTQDDYYGQPCWVLFMFLLYDYDVHHHHHPTVLPLLLHHALLHPVVFLLHPDYLQHLFHPLLKPFSKFSSSYSIMWPNISIITLACSQVNSFIYVDVWWFSEHFLSLASSSSHFCLASTVLKFIHLL